jgi:hypothetical protein
MKPKGTPMTTALSTHAEGGAAVQTLPIVRPAPLPEAWDPFQLMDRLDEDALKKELEGIASTDLVYVVKEGGQEVVGLSKVGVDECCMVLVSQGQVIREEDLAYEILGTGEEQEALFKVRAARYAVSPGGIEVRLDQVLGVKRQPLYYEAQQLDLDSKVPGKKYKGRTYRELLGSDDGRDYLGWMAENFSDEGIKAFVRAILSGEDARSEGGRHLNPHWFEAGAMKAARNARFRLIPADTKALIMARARQNGQARVVEGNVRGVAQARASIQNAEDATEQLRREEAQRQDAAARGGHEERQDRQHPGEPPRATSVRGTVEPTGAYAPTEKQIAFYQRLAESPVFTEDERRRALEWLATRATRQTIKDQIDWLKRQVETRRASRGQQ